MVSTIDPFFTWSSMDFLLTHLPLLVHIVMECPLTIILIYLFAQKQTNLGSLLNSIILIVAFYFFIYALRSSFYMSNTQCTQIICHFLHSSGLLFLFQLLPNFPIVFLCFFHFWLHFLKSESKTNNSVMIKIFKKKKKCFQNQLLECLC